MYSYYVKLTGNTQCQMYGGHWRDIGFQDSNPYTDLRALGMFGPLQMLAFVEYHKDLLVEIWKYTQDDERNRKKFPLSTTMLNMSQLALNSLRLGKLSSMIKKRTTVISAVNQLYFALLWEVYREFRFNGKTIEDYGYIKKELERRVVADPGGLVLSFEKRGEM